MTEHLSPESIDTSTVLGPLTLRTPIITASGTFGYGKEYDGLVDFSAIGAVTAKGVTLEPRPGNPAPRICETPSGMLNAIGLENPGVDVFIGEKLPWLAERSIPTIANINGTTVDEYAEMARRLTGCEPLVALEVNISCPNVEHGGMEFGRVPEATSEVVSAVRAATDLPVMVKLSPNVTDICLIAKAAVEAGADILSLTNTLLGMSIDVHTRRPHIARGKAGLSGPAIKPVAVRMVHEVYQALPEVPLVGMGGIMTGDDAVEFMLAGASAVGVGTASFVSPSAAADILSGIRDYCLYSGFPRTSDLTGALEL